jgi:hypothetical protein
MLRSVVMKVVWVGRATVFLVGLAVILAVLIGLASRATAHTGSVGLFHLNHSNTGTALTDLQGAVANFPMLRITNNGAGTALGLRVPSDKPPLFVNSSTKVGNFNADLLDGNDSSAFLPNKTYAKSLTSMGDEIVTGRRFLATYCDPGDKIISGGHYEMDVGTTLYGSTPDWFHQGWQVEWINDGTADSMTVTAYCADFGTPHTP